MSPLGVVLLFLACGAATFPLTILLVRGVVAVAAPARATPRFHARLDTATGLSLAAAMRQSMRLGLPRLREQLAPPATVKPFTRAEAKRAFVRDPEGDALAARLAGRSRPRCWCSAAP